MNRHLIILLALWIVVAGVSAQSSSLRKLSPSLRHLYFERQTVSPMSKAPLVGESSEQDLCAFVKVGSASDEVFADHGVRVLASFDDIHIVSIPWREVMPFASETCVNRIELAKGMSVLNHDMPKCLNIDKVYEGAALPQAYTGKGVVMGIMDVGFDLTNPNFYSSDMSDYRIKAFWDMLSPDTVGSKLYVGNDYVGKEAILALGRSYDGLQQNHGSHTLGTAAGSGAGTKYRGVAYESDICLVNNLVTSDSNLVAKKDLYKYTYATDALGFKYIFDYAASQNKPCVISFSEGSLQDLYGDNILFNEMLSKLVGPGRIICASAGNNSHNVNYIHKPYGVESAGTFLESWGDLAFLATGRRDYDFRYVFYGEKNDTLTISTDWLCSQPDSIFHGTFDVESYTFSVSFYAYPDCYDNERLVVETIIKGPDHIGGSNLPLSMEIVGSETEVEVHKLAGYFTMKPQNPLLCDAAVSRNINCPSSFPSVICVGATAYKTSFVNLKGETVPNDRGSNGQRSTFSSIGPTLDGRVKPDVMAPGTNIVSSTNSYYFEANPESPQFNDLVSSYEYDGRTHYWKADTGTSMSSPAVGGAIALWLQAKPDLTPDEVMDVFAHTCSRPDDSMEYPNNEYGYGQIDVYRGLLYILGIDGISDISSHQPEKVAFSIVAPQTFRLLFAEPLSRSAVVRVYDTSGQLLHTAAVEPGARESDVTLPDGVRGVVVVQVDGGSAATTGSTLLRLGC